jgi:hypothetical protein
MHSVAIPMFAGGAYSWPLTRTPTSEWMWYEPSCPPRSQAISSTVAPEAPGLGARDDDGAGVGPAGGLDVGRGVALPAHAASPSATAAVRAANGRTVR